MTSLSTRRLRRANSKQAELCILRRSRESRGLFVFDSSRCESAPAMKGFRAGADYQCWQDARERLLAVNHKIVHFDELAGLLLAFDRLAEALGVNTSCRWRCRCAGQSRCADRASARRGLRSMPQEGASGSMSIAAMRMAGWTNSTSSRTSSRLRSYRRYAFDLSCGTARPRPNMSPSLYTASLEGASAAASEYH